MFWRASFIYLFAITCGATQTATAACVWKVIGPKGGALYLGGSWHALRSTDYPLPPAYNMAFDASSRLAFETSPKDDKYLSKALFKAGEYPRGDSLKNHVDPRTYDYVRRLFGLAKVPEKTFSRYRPWFLSMMLTAGRGQDFFGNLGVESFLERRALANSKPMSGLESAREHLEVFSGLSERASEALLLVTLIPSDKSTADFQRVMTAWRRGDSETIANSVREGFRDFPAMSERLLGTRNRKWIPKLEQYLASGQTYFVVAGAAHFGGSDGVLTLLKDRGYKIQQL